MIRACIEVVIDRPAVCEKAGSAAFEVVLLGLAPLAEAVSRTHSRAAIRADARAPVEKAQPSWPVIRV